jgi:thimet oligopeptidase
MRLIPVLLLALVFAACRSAPESRVAARAPSDPAAQPAPIAPLPTNLPVTTFAEFAKRARHFKAVVALPKLETTPAAIQSSVSNTMARAELVLAQIASCQLDQLTLPNTVGALDDVDFEAGLVANRMQLLKETGTNAAVRNAATDAAKAISEWVVGIEYREDVYATVKKYADKSPRLVGEEARLLNETMRDYKRAGLSLPKPERDEVERLRKELTRLTTDFESNVTKAEAPVKFTRAELDGVPESFLSQEGVKTGDDEFTVLANVTFHYTTVMEQARKEATRRKLLLIRDNLARADNAPLLQRIVELRDKIARKLGYASWADYQIEPKMAKTAAAARDFCEKLKTGLQPKFAAEIEQFHRLKVRDTGDPAAKIQLWDWRYYQGLVKKEKYTVDTEALRVYFPYERCLLGMFHVYQTIFGLRFERMEPPAKWCENLELFAVSDAESGEPLGLFYLDMFPREGKYNHFAEFGIIDGKALPGGVYQRPTVALVCNFPPPSGGRPSLLSHHEVETLFHEFGHAMHAILTRARFTRFSGNSVPRDFVEAPSQMLEYWVWDKRVLDSFAADYRDQSKIFPQETLARMKQAEQATSGVYYRRQLAFALMDLALHTQVRDGAGRDVIQLSNDALSEVFLPTPPDTAFACYFGHLMDYDAGYYGYAWAEAIAADMATVFEKSIHGFYDTKAGRRLRDEIYAVGDSREAAESIEKFLGRKQDIGPFLKKVGIDKK